MSLKQMGVLVVDDEPVDLAVITQILHVICGFTVFGAANVEDAVQTFKREAANIDLLVSDISLPTGSGIELARTLIESKPGLKVLLISGLTGAAELRVMGVPLDDRHFLPKPFRSSKLINRVHEILATDQAVDWLEGGSQAAKSGGAGAG